MSKISLRQIKDYFLLLIITGSAIVFSIISSGDKTKLRGIVAGLSLLYILWGLFHHKNEGTLKKEIAAEYIIFSILGATIVIGLL